MEKQKKINKETGEFVGFLHDDEIETKLSKLSKPFIMHGKFRNKDIDYLNKKKSFSEEVQLYKKNFQTNRLEKNGKENRQEKIESQNVGLTVQELYNKYLETGDTSYFNKSQLLYDDVSEYPTSLNELKEKFNAMEGVFKDVQSLLTKNTVTDIQTENMNQGQHTKPTGDIKTNEGEK